MEGNNIPGKKAIQLGAAFGMALFSALIFAHPANAATTLAFPNNTFPDGYTLTAANSPYIVQSTTIKVGANTTVTMEQGAVIKLKTGLQFPVQIIVEGTLIANGTADEPVVITSIHDNAYGGDTNQDGSEIEPAPGNWHRIITQAGGTITLHWTYVRYGGSSSAWGAITSSNGAVDVSDSVVEYSSSHGVLAYGLQGVAVVRDSIIRNNRLAGVRAYIGGRLTVEGSSLLENKYGVVVSDTPADRVSLGGNSMVDNTSAGLLYEYGTGQLDAANNWWGDNSGPYHATGNPGGTGDIIIGNVAFDPWTNQAPANTAPVLSYVDDEGYGDDGVSPNISFITQDVPVFFVSYSDSDGDDAQYVRLIVGDDAYAMATSTDDVFEFTPDAGVFGKGVYSYYFEASDGVDVVRLPAEGELAFEVKLVPVILVPGIMGTELWKGDDLLWPDLEDMAFWWLDDFLDPIAMDFDGNPSDNGVAVGDGIKNLFAGAHDIFNSLITNLESSGYEENVDLFIFPYDWRLDIRDSSQDLEQKIVLVLGGSNSQKVNLIAHSMGGLLAKDYILENGSEKLGKIVFVGTPHLGSPKSTKTLLFGDDLIRIFLSLLNPQKFRYLSQNMLSVYQLLPSQEYVRQIGKYFYDLTIPVSYTHEEVNNYLTVQGLNSSHIQSATDFHSSDLDNFSIGALDAYNIVGCDTATLGKIIIRNQKLLETEYGIEFVAGDGTVPFGSASAINTLADNTFYATGIEHATMPSQSSIKQLITQIITGDINISALENITQDINQCVFNGQVVSVHSPVDLHIYDANGNHVGPDENGDIELNIAGATYEQIGDNKFIFIPNTDSVSYEVRLEGTGEGTFSVRVSKVENNEVTETAYYSDIPVNESSQAQITLSDNISATVLQVDESGSGSFETVSVAAVLDSEQSEDTVKPSTAINVSEGTSSSSFTLSASDDNSGVLKTEYSLDNGNAWYTYENQVILNTIGEHSVLYRSKDRAGNLEDSQNQIIRVFSSAVILLPAPAPTAQPPSPFQGEGRGEGVNEVHEPQPEILGEKILRPQGEQYTESDILTALADADIATLMDYLGRERDIALEQSISRKYGQGLLFGQGALTFISYGTKSTHALGVGERAGVLYSFKEAFGRLPGSTIDWDDVVKISTNKMPSQRSAEAEQRAKDAGAGDEESIMIIAYGLRPTIRSLELEQEGIISFIKIYGRLPSSTLDWNILRSIVY